MVWFNANALMYVEKEMFSVSTFPIIQIKLCVYSVFTVIFQTTGGTHHVDQIRELRLKKSMML